MARLHRNPLTGQFAEASMLFLRDNGFINISMCSDKSVWVCKGIQIHIEPKKDVINYDTLFQLIYDSGINYGKWTERKNLTNVLTTFIQGYGKPRNEDDY